MALPSSSLLREHLLTLISHKLQSSVQLTVDAAATNATGLGSSFAISSNGVDTDGTTANTISAGTITSGVYPAQFPQHRTHLEVLSLSVSPTRQVMLSRNPLQQLALYLTSQT